MLELGGSQTLSGRKKNFPPSPLGLLGAGCLDAQRKKFISSPGPGLRLILTLAGRPPGSPSSSDKWLPLPWAWGLLCLGLRGPRGGREDAGSGTLGGVPPQGCSLNDQGTSCMITFLLVAGQGQGRRAPCRPGPHAASLASSDAGGNTRFCQLVCGLFEPLGKFAQSCSLVPVARGEGRKYTPAGQP